MNFVRVGKERAEAMVRTSRRWDRGRDDRRERIGVKETNAEERVWLKQQVAASWGH